MAPWDKTGWAESEGKGFEFARRVRVRGVYRFSSLVKQNKKRKNCAVFCFAGKRKLLFYILRCDYITTMTFSQGDRDETDPYDEVIFGTRRPDSVAIEWTSKTVYVLEFKRTSDQRHNYRE